MGQAELTDYAAGMYQRVNEFWSDRKSEIFNGACGFSILSGPPVFAPKLMIIGTNPGLGRGREPLTQATWPERSCITDSDWDLAKELRLMFRKIGLLEALDGTMQTNFQFFRSSSVNGLKIYRWKSLPSSLRSELNEFCLHELDSYVKLSQPELIWVFGLGTCGEHLTDAVTVVPDASGKKRVVLKGKVFGFPAYGSPHPSGAMIYDSWIRMISAMHALLG